MSLQVGSSDHVIAEQFKPLKLNGKNFQTLKTRFQAFLPSFMDGTKQVFLRNNKN